MAFKVDGINKLLVLDSNMERAFVVHSQQLRRQITRTAHLCVHHVVALTQTAYLRGRRMVALMSPIMSTHTFFTIFVLFILMFLFIFTLLFILTSYFWRGQFFSSQQKPGLTDSQPFYEIPEPFYEIPDEDSCFCQLQGPIDDCACQIDTVDRFNNYKIYPRLQSLLKRDYFRYFQVNLRRECLFWSDDGQCASEYCQVKECKEEKLPPALKGQGHSFKGASRLMTLTHINPKAETIPCGRDLGYINTTISEESQEGFARWRTHDNSSVCEDEVDLDIQYVDLLLNPERFTGYAGSSAHRVWNSIYNKNCFKSGSRQNVMSPFAISEEDELCIEKRTFYRALSGLHSSINIHVSSKYLLTKFKQHFDTSRGQTSAWLKNLYFLYLIELKAIWKLSDFLRAFDLYTGNPEEDEDVKAAILDLLRVVDGFPSHFEETALFSGREAMKLKSEFHHRFTNITEIMDCVGCQKCKLWGKLQIKGLGTALKVLFTENSQFMSMAKQITRNELVALINGFGRLSESIYELGNFRTSLKKEPTHHNHMEHARNNYI